MVRVDIPGLPPSVNRLYGYRAPTKGSALRKGTPDRYLLEAGRRFKSTVGFACLAAKARKFPDCVRLEVRIYLYTQNRRRLDIDNRIKALKDGLTEWGLWNDDSQVWRESIERIYDANNPEKTVVYVGEYQPKGEKDVGQSREQRCGTA